VEKYTTKSFKETQKLGENFAQEILASTMQKTALVLGLWGDLGAGKTTFLQGFAKGLGIGEKINSPTFVILKRFGLKNKPLKNFYHIDCYRLHKPEEILDLGFKEIISDPQNIVAVEWPEKIKKVLPKNTVNIKFQHLEKNQRNIIIFGGFNV